MASVGGGLDFSPLEKRNETNSLFCSPDCIDFTI
jgi:hypothetical protein